MTSSWPFIVQGIDLIGRLPKRRGSVQYVVVAFDYFTKWVEAETLASIVHHTCKDQGVHIQEYCLLVWSPPHHHIR